MCRVGKGTGAFFQAARQGACECWSGRLGTDTRGNSIPGRRNGNAQSEAGVRWPIWGTISPTPGKQGLSPGRKGESQKG